MTKSATTKPVSPLAIAAAQANRAAVTSALSFESAAEVLEQAFIDSAKAFAAARDGKVTIAALAKAIKAEAGESSVDLHGVQFFTSNASIEAHAYTGRIMSLPGSLADGVSVRDLQTLVTQVYNTQGGVAEVKHALTADDVEAAYLYLKSLTKKPAAPKGIAALLKAAEGVVAKAEKLAEEGDEVDTEALVSLAHLLKSLLVIDASVDRTAMADEAADLASLSS